MPLYRHLVKEVAAVAGADFDNLIMGYVLLPKNLDDVGFAAADWSRELLLTADEKTREIIRHLRKAAFWPPAENPPKFSDDLAGICQDNVFEQFDVNSLDADGAEVVAPW